MSTENRPEPAQENGEESLKSPATTAVAGDEIYSASPYFSANAGKRQLPEWLDHFNAKDLKELFKCSVAAWVTTILIFIRPTLNVLGQAAFFGSLVQFIVPPSGVVFVQVLAGSTLILGCCLAWAWGVITMKAALATRPAAEVNAKLASLARSAPQNTTNAEQASGQAAYAQIQIYNGYMLDARVSVTYFCMICLFIYFMARLRITAPKMTLVSMFAMIVSDIFLTVAPLLPSFKGTIPQTLIKPAAVSVGIGLVCNILIFPRSTSHAVMDGMRDVLRPMSGFLVASALHLQDPSRRFQLDHLQKVRLKVIEDYKQLEAGLAFLGLDMSVGRWSSEDIASLKEPLQRLLMAFLGVMQFHISREQLRRTEDNYASLRDEAVLGEKHDDPQNSAGNLQLRKALNFRDGMRHPDMGRFFAESLATLHVSSKNLLETCGKSLAALDEGLTECNAKRWFGRLSEAQCHELQRQHVELSERLEKERETFVKEATERLWASRSDMFDEKGVLKEQRAGSSTTASLGGVMLALTFEKKISDFAVALEGLLNQMASLEEQRTKTKLWLPKGIRNLFGWALNKEDPVPGALAKTVTSDQGEVKPLKSKPKRKRRSKKDNEAGNAPEEVTAKSQLKAMNERHGGVQRGKGGQFLLKLFQWLVSTEGLFALRVVVVTIALGVPAVIPNSAGFYYREKGLWGLIMAQTGLVEFTADFVVGLGVRLVGTVCGGIIGLVVWYIGAGNGPGNPYGMAAVMAVVVVIFMWFRLFTPPSMLQAVILTVATIYLVMAYSWVDTHIPSYGNPGVGYNVFWRRTLLVIIGFVAGAVVTFFPRPPSANRHYRQLLAQQLLSVQTRYAVFASNCRRGVTPPSDLAEVAREQAIDATEVLMRIAKPIQFVRFEFSSSPFDAKTLSDVCRLCGNLNLNITQLLLCVTKLSGPGRTRFILVSGAVNEELVGDIMAVLTIIQQSLHSGEPLSSVLPVPLLARSMEKARTRMIEYRSRLQPNEQTFAGEMALTKDVVTDEGFRQYAEAIGAFIEMMSNLDELVIVVKRAVGEACMLDLQKDTEVGGVVDSTTLDLKA